jgi:MFS transporter, putative metabolite:H+ symporter
VRPERLERPAAPELVPIRQAYGAILFAGLGYFVDIFDLLLFAVVRVASVRDLGAGDRTIEVGTLLQNSQLIGLMVGGLVWGMLGDRRGRRSALYGSILLYSLANIANAFVTSVPQYAAWRFVAGFGLAGELGAALTLVSEMVDRRERGTATTFVATIGVMGAVAAAIVGELVPWRTAYLIGGGLGLVLLMLRFRLRDSAMFGRTRDLGVRRGNVWRLVNNPDRAARYLRAILIGVPVWFTNGILITFSPELSKALGVIGDVTPGRAVLVYYAATTFGDLSSGLLSQWLRSRRRSVAIFYVCCVIGVVAYLSGVARTPAAFYAICAWLGFATGFWAVGDHGGGAVRHRPPRNRGHQCADIRESECRADDVRVLRAATQSRHRRRRCAGWDRGLWPRNVCAVAPARNVRERSRLCRGRRGHSQRSTSDGSIEQARQAGRHPGRDAGDRDQHARADQVGIGRRRCHAK